MSRNRAEPFTRSDADISVWLGESWNGLLYQCGQSLLRVTPRIGGFLFYRQPLQVQGTCAFPCLPIFNTGHPVLDKVLVMAMWRIRYLQSCLYGMSENSHWRP